MERKGRTTLIALAAFVILSGLAQANHFPADGSPRTIHGVYLVAFILVALWPVQVGLALLVYWDAGLRGMGHRRTWLVLVGLPVVGHLVAVSYYVYTRPGDRGSGGTADPGKDPGHRKGSPHGGRS